MKADKILFIDTETGGLDPKVNSLLSIAFVVWQDFKILATKEILINDGVLNVTSESLRINGINLKNHMELSVNPSRAIGEINKFLSEFFKDDEKITLGGHNINFDVSFFKSFSDKYGYPYSKTFSHRIVDTATILYYLYLGGKIKEKAISSSEAFSFFGIPVESRHTALGDAVATARLFSVLLKIITKNSKVNTLKGEGTLDLFE